MPLLFTADRNTGESAEREKGYGFAGKISRLSEVIRFSSARLIVKITEDTETDKKHPETSGFGVCRLSKNLFFGKMTAVEKGS